MLLQIRAVTELVANHKLYISRNAELSKAANKKVLFETQSFVCFQSFVLSLEKVISQFCLT